MVDPIRSPASGSNHWLPHFATQALYRQTVNSKRLDNFVVRVMSFTTFTQSQNVWLLFLSPHDTDSDSLIRDASSIRDMIDLYGT